MHPVAEIRRWPLRTRQSRSRALCVYCHTEILLTHRYYDGGSGRFYHEWCVNSMESAAREVARQGLQEIFHGKVYE